MIEGEGGGRGTNLFPMEVQLKKPAVVAKDERKAGYADDEEVGEVGKFGNKSPTHDEDSSKSPSPNRKDSSITKQVSAANASERSSVDTSSRPSSSNLRDSTTISQEDQLKSTRQEMGEVREENERLKMVLARIVGDYQSLQLHFFDIVQQEQSKKPVEHPPIPIDVEEPELVSLCLGTSSSGNQKEKKMSTSKSKESDQIEEGLTLGLDCKFEGSSNGANEPQANLSPDNSFEEPKEEEAGEPWPPSKILKNLRSGEDEVSQQAHVKKARVSVRARCDAPTMNDGCQWRKYGQKIAKGNPCPRAYYRCTVAPACPVRKQVQRCAEDMSILITTYEGTHNHPLPVSATAMASTTSAAACMLMSGSSASRPAIGSPVSSAATTMASANTNLHGVNFSLSDNSMPRQLYLPNTSISSSPSYPTITLDLTAPPSSTSQPSQFNRFSSSFTTPSRYSSTSFSFPSSESNSMPSSWSNGYLSYGVQPYSKSQIGSLNLGRPSQESFYQSYLQKASNQAHATPTPNPLTDTIAKAITSDPSFQSALAAAITSYVGAQGAQGGGEGLSNALKWGEHFASVQPHSTTPASNGCASSYLTRSTSSNSNPQQGNLLFLQSPVAFSSSKSASASPVDNRENIN